MRCRTKGRVVEGRGRRATLSGPTGQWPSMPPAGSTEGCATHGPISTAQERSMGMAHEMLNSTPGLIQPDSLFLLLTGRAGNGFQPSTSCAAPRCSLHSSLDAKGALAEHPPGAGAPTGHPPGRNFQELIVIHPLNFSFLFRKATKWVLGHHPVHVLGSRNYSSGSRSPVQANRRNACSWMQKVRSLSTRLVLARPLGTRRRMQSNPHGCERRAHWAPAWGRRAATQWAPDLSGTSLGSKRIRLEGEWKGGDQNTICANHAPT